MTATPDPYAVLGVAADATDDELDCAFRALVRRHHPDTRTPSAPDAVADQRLQDILAAYASLRGPIPRAAADLPTAEPPRRTTRRAVPIRTAPAIRVGPVHWKPLPR